MPNYSNIFNSFLSNEEDESKDKNLFDNILDSFLQPSKVESKIDDSSNVLLDRLKTGDYDYEIGEAPVEEEIPTEEVPVEVTE